MHVAFMLDAHRVDVAYTLPCAAPQDGFKYMFVSNSDNLGATMDLKLLTWFAQSKAPFAMEVAARTDADKKGVSAHDTHPG